MVDFSDVLILKLKNTKIAIFTNNIIVFGSTSYCCCYQCDELPEEVLSAVEFSVSREASFAEAGPAVDALDTTDVPGPVQHVQQEPVDNGPFTPGTDHHHRYAAFTCTASVRVRERPSRLTAGDHSVTVSCLILEIQAKDNNDVHGAPNKTWMI